MEPDEVMWFGGVPYRTRSVFYRTKGGKNHRIVTAKNAAVEFRRTYYIVEGPMGQRYWVKEYTDPAFGHGIDYEYAETSRLSDPTRRGGHQIAAVQLYARTGTRLLAEFLSDHAKLADCRLGGAEKDTLKDLLGAWIEEHDVHDYDMSVNNLMVRVGDALSCRLLDFEYSKGVNRRAWQAFMARHL